jgi:hypothetical protein
MPEEQPKVKSDVEAFMLVEFETYRDMRASLNTLVATETNIYVAIVAATFLALAFAGQFVSNDDTLFSQSVEWVLGVALGILSVVYLLGWAIYMRVVSSLVTVARYARYMNRVRNYYYQRDELARPFIGSDIHDDLPPFGSVGGKVPRFNPIVGNTGMISILNGSILAAIVGISYNLLNFSTFRVFSLHGFGITWYVIWCVVAFGLSVIVHHKYQLSHYAASEREYVAYHPSPKKKVDQAISAVDSASTSLAHPQSTPPSRLELTAIEPKERQNVQALASDVELLDPKLQSPPLVQEEPHRRET